MELILTYKLYMKLLNIFRNDKFFIQSLDYKVDNKYKTTILY